MSDHVRIIWRKNIVAVCKTMNFSLVVSLSDVMFEDSDSCGHSGQSNSSSEDAKVKLTGMIDS